MSVSNHPTCGYAVKASTFVIGLAQATAASTAYGKDFDAALSDNSLGEFLENASDEYRDAFESDTGFAFPSFAYIPCTANGDDSGDLEADEWYVMFEEDALYVLQPTKLMAGMQKAGVEPSLCAWSTFG